MANGEFFLLTLPDGSRLVHPIAAGVRHPLNFGREVCKASMLLPSPASACCSRYYLGRADEGTLRHHEIWKITGQIVEGLTCRCVLGCSVP